MRRGICPDTAPLAYDVIPLGDDAIDGPGGAESLFVFSPVLREMLGALDWRECGGKEVMNDIGRQRAQKLIEITGVAPVEVFPHDFDILGFDGLHSGILRNEGDRNLRTALPVTPNEM
jgi:hypothetical protein